MFVRSTALLAMVVLAACSSNGSNNGITGNVPPASQYVGASIGTSSGAPASSFSVVGTTGTLIPSQQGNALAFVLSESIQGAPYTGTFTVVASPASCITVTGSGTNFTATAACTTLPSTGTFTVSDTVGNTAPLTITTTP